MELLPWVISRNPFSIWTSSARRRRTEWEIISIHSMIFNTAFYEVLNPRGLHVSCAFVFVGNKPHSNCTQRHFTFNDPRTRYSMRRCDPRIHFALNCAARSCPQIAIYSSTNLEKALNMATTSYCNAEVDIILENAEVRLSKIFLWYKTDFGRSETEVLRWVAGGSSLLITVASRLDGSPSISTSRNNRCWKPYWIDKARKMVYGCLTWPTIGCWIITMRPCLNSIRVPVRRASSSREAIFLWTMQPITE